MLDEPNGDDDIPVFPTLPNGLGLEVIDDCPKGVVGFVFVVEPNIDAAGEAADPKGEGFDEKGVGCWLPKGVVVLENEEKLVFEPNAVFDASLLVVPNGDIEVFVAPANGEAADVRPPPPPNGDAC